MKFFKWAVIIFVLMLGVEGASQDERGEAANAAYLAGDYNTAISAYEALLVQEQASGSLYFNLGSAYFQSGSLGEAMLNFKRAQSYIPRDNDLNTAIAAVRAARADLQGEERAPFDRTASLTRVLFTPRELSVAVVGLLTGLGILGAVVVSKPEWRRLLTPVLIVIAVMATGLMGLWGNRAWVERYRPLVIVQDEISLYSGAGENYLELFRLGAGAELRVAEQQDDWGRVILPNGRQGWVLLSNVAFVRPARN